jgi:hypothetical protein
MSNAVKLSVVEMKALLPPMPVLANESQEQFEKFFDQVVIALDVKDPVEMILIRDFVWPSWEIARYTRHRVVAFDRKFKGVLESQVGHLQSQKARREALAQRLAEYLAQRPAEASHMAALEDKVIETDIEMAQILKHTPGELAYNRALEHSIGFHKDLEFLIISATKRRDQALDMLDRYRNGLGRHVNNIMNDIFDAEFGFFNGKLGETLTRQIVPPLAPAEQTENQQVAESAATTEAAQHDLAAVSASKIEDNGNGSKD